ncbi:helix-turn-helix transcriptional regulator [Oscillospiraceae bacterium 44-5]
MENYGLTVRQIRLSKGFSLKEIYTGILSKSFAIDFEKGLYDIKFHFMLKILDRLMISVDELLLIHNEYQRLRCYEPLLNIKILQFPALTLCNSANGGRALIFRRFRHLPFGRVIRISRRIPA